MEMEDDLTLLSWTAREAGKIAMRYFQQAQKVWVKSSNSPVSEADFAVDSFLKRELLSARPDYGWISEESRDDRTKDTKDTYSRFFVVDPIDGTRGFIERKTGWCISIAVVEDGRPIVGVLECPAKREQFLTKIGTPALLNGQVIRVALSGARSRLLIFCQKSILNRLPAPFVQSVTPDTSIPSLAYRLALLSSGRLDVVFIRSGCHDWDIAAADIILKQSGGTLAGMTGHPIRYHRPSSCHGFLLACGNDMFQSIVDIASQADFN
ncbi:MAG: Inositol monophosphatase family protein [Candidatus Tokpelaia sp. JSC085]|nr:MAG: Inositol monophosphatase family protein [Candidatus Tokpelaia sp. JSC085]